MEYNQFERQSLLKHGRNTSSYGGIDTESKKYNEANLLTLEQMADQGYRIISSREVVLPQEYGFLSTVQRLWAISSRSNTIRTTKYTLLTFLPKNLFEQFHRFANWYFLFIIILNFVPQIQAFGREVSMIPLLFVLSVTAVKDAFEDLRRFRSDREVNNREVLVYDWETEEFVTLLWRQVCVGDFVKLSINEVIPADILLLHSSEQDSICYIETANIDGETNLKQRQVAQQSSDSISVMSMGEFQPAEFSGAIYCEPPHSKIYDFSGYIVYPDGKRIPVNRNNLLLRGCVLRNTEAVIGIVAYAGHETKSMLNNSGPRTKRSKLERDINAEILSSLVILLALCIAGSIGTGVWTQERFKPYIQFLPKDDDDSPGLEAFIRFWTFLIVLQVIVPISLYITMEIVKFIQVYFINWDIEMYYAATDTPFQCRALNINEDLGQIEYIFSDKTGTLTENQMRFQCCTINGINYPHQLKEELDGIQEALQNQRTLKKLKGSKVDKFCYDSDLQSMISGLTTEDENCLHDFFVVLAICNTVVVSKRSKEKKDSEPVGEVAYNMENLSESVLSEIERVLGHTNINAIEYEAESPDEQALVEAARKYGYVMLARVPGKVTILTPHKGVVEYHVMHVLEFDSRRKCMSVVVREKGTDQVILYTKGADSAIYSFLDHHSGLKYGDYARLQEEESTRASLTQAQLNLYARLGLRTLCMAKRVLSKQEYEEWLTGHHEAEVSLTNRDELLFESYLAIEKKLELLGATGIEDRLQDGVPEAIAGLRQAGMKVWVLTGDKQETAINVGYSSQLFDEVMDIIIINATSEEACRESLEYRVKELEMQAGVETAASSTSSLDNAFILSAYTTPIIKLAKSKINKKDARDYSSTGPPKAMVIDGATLAFALQDSMKELFLEVTKYCKSVICCRATPLQKTTPPIQVLTMRLPKLMCVVLQQAQVVQLVKTKLNAMTLGIGDGANDVSMIQMADVGVGISGREGMQAVIASDFAMGRFHFLQKLLLVHGHWCYSRLARLILYFFYKNVAFAVLLFWFQIINGYSGSNPVDGVNLFMFNLAYTSLPIIVVGVADQDLKAEELLKNKSLYNQGRLSLVYTRGKFWIAMLEAFYQSLVVFLVASSAYHLDVIGLVEFGFIINISIVFTVTFHLAIETYHWTIANHVVMWGSLIFTIIFNLIYCAIDTRQVFIDTYQVFQVTASRGKFWFILVLIPFIALFPRLLFRVIRQELFPSEVLKARALEKQGQPYCNCLHKAPINESDNSVPIEPVSFSRIQANHNT